MATFKKRYKTHTLTDSQMSPAQCLLTCEGENATLFNLNNCLTRRCSKSHTLLSGLTMSSLLTQVVTISLLLINILSVDAGQISHSFASFNSPSLLPVASSYSSLTSSTFSIAASPPSSQSAANNHDKNYPFLHNQREGNVLFASSSPCFFSIAIVTE